MLTHLSIRNIVLIARADIPFEDGLCVLTGETGAGKSILLDALALALGQRAESRLIREGESEASVTASFDIRHAESARNVLVELGLPGDDEVIIRRQLLLDGKGRCFVNDQPVSVTALKRLGEALVEIHGQHDQRGLLDIRTHLDQLDAYGRLESERESVGRAFEAWHAIRGERDHLILRVREVEREQDYLQHMAHELRELQPEPGEEEQLSIERSRMMQGAKMAGLLQDALSELQNPQPIMSVLGSVQRLLTRSQAVTAERAEPVVAALDRAQIELQDAQAQLEQLLVESAYDPERLEQAEERLFALKAAARKYQVLADSLPDLLGEVEEKLRTLDSQQHRMAALDAREAEAQAAYLAQAQRLSDARAMAAQRLQKALVKELEPLKMGRCRFRVVQEELPRDHWSARGTDHVRFEVATNAGQAYAPLHKIASGGELSRFMLALKVVLSSLRSTPTLIFDEIDTGTGGAVADAIGARLALLSDQVQILVVTHLPQVAARGNHHLFIEKSGKANKTETAIRVLGVPERKEELARMLAGAEVTDEARGAAQKLMEAAG